MITVVERPTAAPPTPAIAAPACRARGGTRARPGWRYAESGRRDLRLDFLRGCAVFAMVADHVAGDSWLYALTGGNRFFVSAAEGFVFISGVVVGIVYGAVARQNGLRAAIVKLLQRAWLLYVLAVWLAAGSALLAAILGLPLGAAFAADPARFLFEVVTLRRTFYLVDVLLLYLFAMLAATGALAALRRGWWWAVAAGSWAAWGAYQVAPDRAQLPWPIADNPVFNFAAWQLLFFMGLLLGYHRRWLGARVAARLPRSPLGDGWVAPLGALVGLLVWLHATDAAALARFVPGGDTAALLDAWFDKGALPLPRLAACAVVFAFAWALATRCWRPLRAALGPVLLTFGQRALYAYAVHLFLATLVHSLAVATRGAAPDGGFPPFHPGVNAAIQAAALALLWVLTRRHFLQAVVAPLGAPPLGQERLRVGRWSLRRPGDALLAVLLVGAVAGLAALPRERHVSATAAPTPLGGGLAASAWQPVSTVTAPRRIGGPALGSSARPATPVATTAAPARPTAAPAASGQAAEGRAARDTPPAGYLVDGAFHSAALGREMPYGVYLPPGYDGDARRYPVLYMLHGIGGHYSEWANDGLLEVAERLIQSGRIPPLIIVLPQGDISYFVNHAGPAGERWGDYIADDLVAHIDATYRTIPRADARAIGGLSMGGFGALTLALTRPDVFGVAGAHSPALRTAEEAPDFLRGPDHFARVDPVALAETANPATAPRLWIDVGVDDEWIDRVTAMKDRLRARGLRPEYSETLGGHGPDYWRQNAGRYLRFYAGALNPPGGR